MTDKQKVIRALTICANPVGKNTCSECPMESLCIITGSSNAAMAAAIKLLNEQEDVIHCRDCDEYRPWENEMICMRLGSWHGTTKPNDYCSYARRKDDERKKQRNRRP